MDEEVEGTNKDTNKGEVREQHYGQTSSRIRTYICLAKTK
jgi:hypothetical protein